MHLLGPIAGQNSSKNGLEEKSHGSQGANFCLEASLKSSSHRFEGQQENEIHLFFLCDFATASWFDPPWYIKSNVLVHDHSNMHNIILALLNINNSHAPISNSFNFLRCIWKERNDCLF